MSTVASLAFFVALLLVAGNAFLEVCEAAAARHRSSSPLSEGAAR